MDWVKGASGQWILSPQPYLTPRSHLPSGMQLRGAKHNPRTCPNWTLDPCQGRGPPTSHGRVPQSQMAPKLTGSGSAGIFDSRSQPHSETEIHRRHYPLEVGG